MKVLFVTFGDGDDDFLLAAERLLRQAESTGLFDSSFALNSQSLSQYFPLYGDDLELIQGLDEFPLYFRAAKTWVILAAFSGAFGPFDVLVYMDSGCEIQNNWLTRIIFKRKFVKAMESGGLAESTMLPEKNWTKSQLLQLFDLDSRVVNTPQVQATWSIWRGDQAGRRLVGDWRTLSLSSEGFWQNPSIEDAQEHLVEHRRDQSIFSLLWKQASYRVEPNSMDFSSDGLIGRLRSLSVPIHATRNRTGSILTPTFAGRSILAPISWALNTLINSMPSNRARRKSLFD